MVYLTRFYALLWSLLGVCVLGILSSKFAFIVPLVFYNKYIDEALWEYRFVVMTVQVMTVPLLAFNMLALYKWPNTRVDLRAMGMVHALKVTKAERRRGTVSGDGSGGSGSGVEMTSSALGAAHASDAEAAGLGDKAMAVRSRFGMRRKSEEGAEDARSATSSKEEMYTRFEAAHQQILEQRQAQTEMGEEMEHLMEKSEGLQDEYDEIVAELQANQGQINAGVKELETLIIRRFETMQEAEDEAKRVKEAKEVANADVGGEGGDDGDDAEMHGLDPAARRQLRRQRLVNEQRKRIAEEEAEKAEADAKIRGLQAELAKLLEANGRLQRKVEACEHNIDETRDAIEDMAFQHSQCVVQKENQLAVRLYEASTSCKRACLQAGLPASCAACRAVATPADRSHALHPLPRVCRCSRGRRAISTSTRRRCSARPPSSPPRWPRSSPPSPRPVTSFSASPTKTSSPPPTAAASLRRLAQRPRRCKRSLSKRRPTCGCSTRTRPSWTPSSSARRPKRQTSKRVYSSIAARLLI